jgi:perosamine synthetase
MSRFIPTHRPTLGAEELAAVGRVFDTGWLGHGSSTAAFEEALRGILDIDHVVAVSSGTAALHLALEALTLPAGSGVVVPSLTFAATVQAILAAGLTPVFCEVDVDTLQIDLDDVRERVTRGTQTAGTSPGPRAIVPVHFGGASCDMTALVDLAHDHGQVVVEDAAHAFGSVRDGQALGTFGTAGCFSFDPIKNITCGEGGAVATRSADVAARLASMRSLGISSDGWSRHTGRADWAYDVRTRGWRCHLSNINAAIGLAQLDRMPVLRARKQAIVRRYAEAFAPLPGLTPVTRACADVFPFTYTVRVFDGRRDEVMAHLRACGVGSAVEYIPNHLHTAFEAFRTNLPVTERLYGEILSLPLSAELSDDDVGRVIDAVTTCVTAGGSG